MTLLINKNYKNKIYKLENILKELSEIVRKTDNNDLLKTTDDLISRIHDPFMFVIAGEVKAGKSSFINALLNTREEICKTGVSPVTDKIQQIVYGKEKEEIIVNDFLVKRYEPAEILKDIAIVDTPGTNTVIKNHHEITERFIPVSDLILFVFEAKNPYRQSAWDFFDFIHAQWHKKIIFILQQKDLMSEKDLKENIEGLKKFAKEKGIKDPVIYAVSAKDEIEGNYEKSNMSAFRDYIKTHVTGGKSSELKIQNYIRTSEKIIDKINEGLETRKQQLEQDKAFRKEITDIMDKQTEKSIQKIDILAESTIDAYDKITKTAISDLKHELSFPTVLKRSISSIFGKNKNIKNRLENIASQMEKDLNKDLKLKSEIHVGDISDTVQQMAQLIDIKVQRSDNSLKNNPVFFNSVTEKRIKTYKELKETFADFLAKSENFAGDKLFPYNKNIAPNVATGSGLAVIGILLTAFTQGAVLDITGGVITGTGIIFAGASIGLRRKKILKKFKTEIKNGRTKLKKELSEKLTSYIKKIKENIDANFSDFDKLIENEEKAITENENNLSEIKEKLNNLKK